MSFPQSGYNVQPSLDVQGPLNLNGKLFDVRQVTNHAVGSVPNLGIGTAVVPAIAAGSLGTVVINDSTIDAGSFVFTQIVNVSDATAGRNVSVVGVHRPAVGTVSVDVFAATAAAAGAYELWYWVLN